MGLKDPRGRKAKQELPENQAKWARWGLQDHKAKLAPGGHKAKRVPRVPRASRLGMTQNGREPVWRHLMTLIPRLISEMGILCTFGFL